MTHEITLKLDDPSQVVMRLRHAVEVLDACAPLSYLADRIEEQVKPAIEEPEEFGSIVRARCPEDPREVESDRWQLSPFHGKHYWQSEGGLVEVWSELTDVEVLRVGLDEPNADECHLEEAAYGHGYKVGSQTMNGSIHQRLKRLLQEAITSERKNALEKAIQAVEELAP